MKNIAVILAGGAGTRIGGELPKQFLKIEERPVIACSIDTFEQHPGIDEIAVVVHPSYVELFINIAKAYNWKKISKVLQGGDTRSESTLSALQAYSHIEEANILFHDAARPMLKSHIVDDILSALKQYAAVTVARDTTDTVLQTDKTQQVIAQIPPRHFLRRMQTPQGFKLSVIRKAYELAAADPDFTATDDCGVVHKYLPEIKIGIVAGDELNLKITTKQDLYLLQELMKLSPAKVVITYGTFDLFHYGHIEILRRAKALGNYLYVGLSTDEFNMMKGKTCVQSYEKRKEVLQGIRYVDDVFPEMSWEQKIADVEKYRAEIFVMGDDWAGKFDFLQPFCKVVYLPRTENISTSLIKEITGQK
jgi:2-C-methyl-D-erythritol 4-phosphate cytidylyltransferase